MENGNVEGELAQKDARIRELEQITAGQQERIGRLENDLNNITLYFQEKEKRFQTEIENLQLKLSMTNMTMAIGGVGAAVGVVGAAHGAYPPSGDFNLSRQGYPPPTFQQQQHQQQSQPPTPQPSQSQYPPPQQQLQSQYPPPQQSQPFYPPTLQQQQPSQSFYPPPHQNQQQQPQQQQPQSQYPPPQQSQQQVSPPQAKPKYPYRADKLGKRFRSGIQVFLLSLSSKCNVRITRFTSTLEALGGEKQMARFLVERIGQDHARIKFQSIGHPNKYLRLASATVIDGDGNGGSDCEFWVIKHGPVGSGDKVYSFESSLFPGSFMAFHSDGKPGKLAVTNFCVSTQFQVRLVPA